MQIKDLTLLELFIETMCSLEDSQSWHKLDEPQLSVELIEGTRETTLAKQLSDRDSFMTVLAQKYEDAGEHKLAGATRKLAEFLTGEDLFSSPDQESHQRLLDYVYPVV